MEKLVLENGVREFEVNSGVLRFNPADPNVLNRFMEARGKFVTIENEMVEQAKALAAESGGDKVKIGQATISLFVDADRKVKKVLEWVFGAGNDFDAIMGGVNAMAPGANGERVITNFLNALLPIMVEGANTYTNQKVDAALTAAQADRESRGAV